MENQIKGKNITIFGANLVYMTCLILFLFAGYYVQSLDIRFGLLITEFVLIALPVIIYILIKKGSIKNILRLNKLSFVDAALVTTIFVSGYFVAVFISLIGNIIVSLFGELIPSPVPIATNPGEYFLYIFIIAVSAGICEEILMRGLMLSAYEKVGMWKSIIFTAVLFGIMHLNVQNLFGPTFLGIVLGFVVYKTNSLYAGILGHFLNNAISVTLGYIITLLSGILPQQDVNAEAAAVTTGNLAIAAILFGFIALITGTIMFFAMKALDDRSKGRADIPADISLSRTLKTLRISWPIYVSLFFFIAMAGLQLYIVYRG